MLSPMLNARRGRFKHQFMLEIVFKPFMRTFYSNFSELFKLFELHFSQVANKNVDWYFKITINSLVRTDLQTSEPIFVQSAGVTRSRSSSPILPQKAKVNSNHSNIRLTLYKSEI